MFQIDLAATDNLTYLTAVSQLQTKKFKLPRE